MSFLQQNIPQPKALFTYMQTNGSKGANVLADNNTHYFVMGFGKLDGDEAFWSNSNPVHEYSAIPRNLCKFWMHEKADEKNKFVQWLYTGADDPIYALGYDRKEQNNERRQQIWGDKVNLKYTFRLPQREYLVPVLKVELDKKSFNVKEGKLMILIVSEGIMKDILAAAANYVTAADASVYGRVLKIVKNTSEKAVSDKYKTSIVAETRIDTSDYDEKFLDARNKIIEDIDVIFNESNGGSYDPNNVWAYLCNHFGGSKEQLIERYHVLTGGISLENSDFQEVDLSDE